ncbi:hypothetical protein, partial [Streptomyces javensis]|uniref:hypothetical protein n=1 Tax=Streptomyces javensis TaxID=114698 RepID=UPI0031DE2194
HQVPNASAISAPPQPRAAKISRYQCIQGENDLSKGVLEVCDFRPLLFNGCIELACEATACQWRQAHQCGERD